MSYGIGERMQVCASQTDPGGASPGTWSGRWRLLPALLASVVAAIVYGITRSRGAFPGESAERMAGIMGLGVTSDMAHPVWDAVARVVVLLPGGSAVGRLNGFSAVCGALAVGLLCLLMAHLLEAAASGERGDQDVLRPEDDDTDVPCDDGSVLDDAAAADPARRARVNRGVMFGSLASAWALLFGTPFWAAATRCHPASFDLLLLLAGAVCLARFGASGAPLWVAFSALFWGVGLVEAPMFMAVALLIPWCLATGVRTGRPGSRDAVAFALGAGFLGVSIGISAAWTSGITLPAVVARVLGTLRSAAAGMTSDTGSVFGLLQTLIPCLLAAAVARRALSQPSFGMRCLHLLLAVLVAVALLDLPFSPWYFVRDSGRLPTVAALLAAMGAGYLVAYGWLDSQGAHLCDSDEVMVACAPWLGKTICGLALAALAVVPWRNLGDADSRKGGFADEIARDALTHLEGCDWIVGNGPVLDQIRIAAQARGQVLHAIPANGAVPPRVLQQVLSDPALEAHAARLREAARTGATAFVTEWLAAKPDAATRVAILGRADLWADAGYLSRPQGLFFRVVDGRAPPLHARDLAACRAFADRLQSHLPFTQTLTPELQRVRDQISRQASLAVNDLGVAFEAAGLRCEAWDTYTEARRLVPENPSARLNQFGLCRAGIHAELRATLAAEVSVMNCRPAAVPTEWDLARDHGALARPENYAAQVRLARLASLPQPMRANLQTAVEFGSEDELVLRGLLQVTFRQRPALRGDAMLTRGDEVLTDAPAYANLAATAVCEGRVREAQQWIARAVAAGVARSNLFLPRMAVRIASGSAELARRELALALAAAPGNLAAWACLAAAASQQRASADFSVSALAGIRQASGGGAECPAMHAIQGFQLLRRGPSCYALARISLRQCLQLDPSLDGVRDALLWLDLASMDEASLSQDTAQALTDAPEHAFAHFAAALCSLEQGDAVAAECHLRRSLAARATAVAQTQLAEALRQQQRFVEAEETARAVLARDDREVLAWRILGHVLMNRACYEDALEALLQAASLSQDAPCVQLLLACVQLHLRRPTEARQIANLYRQRWQDLPDVLRREEATLDRMLAGRSSNEARSRQF